MADPEFFPIGASIRNWAPTQDVFILLEGYDSSEDVTFHPGSWSEEGKRNQTELQWWGCSFGDGCLTQVDEATDGVVDTNIYGDHYQHPSMGIRRTPSGRVQLRTFTATSNDTDCDGDGLNIFDGDIDDFGRADLRARVWNSGLGFGITSWPETGGECSNVGVTVGRIHLNSAVAHACYTFDPDNNDTMIKDTVRCGSEAGVTADGEAWTDVFTASGDHEDHPGFDFDTLDPSTAKVVAATVYRGVPDNEIRVNFPDEAGGPYVVFASGTPGSMVDFPSLYTGADRLFLVWSESKGDNDANARVLYQTCFLDTDCTLQASWLATPQVLADAATGFNRAARHPEMVVDGDKRFTVYSYDSDPGAGGAQFRLAMAYTCGWSGSPVGRELIRTPDFDDDDQITGIGKPSIVLNKPEGLIHVAFVELDEDGYSSPWSEGNAVGGQAFWAWRAYPGCP